MAGLIALAMAAAPATSASAGTLHVTNGNDAGAGTLRQAIAEAQTSGDTIVIDPGVTKVTVASPLTIDKSLVVQGQGAGATQIASSVPSFWRIFEVGIVTQGISVRIEALKISGGRGPAGTPGVNENPGPGFLPAGPGGAGGSGGAILNRANQLTLADLTLSENIAGTGGRGGESITGTLPPGSGGAGGSGGAISNSGTMTILRSTLAGNEAGVGGFPGITPSSTPAFASSGAAGGGGAISNNGTMAIVDSTISGNRAAAGNLGSSSPSGIGENGTAGGGGGAIQNTGTLTLSRSTLSGNVAGTGGNGSSGFTTNGAGGTGGSGGALFLNGGGAQITNSTFSGNYAGPGGGGGGFGFSFGGAGGSGGSGGAIMVTNGATVTLAASTLSGNAVGKGGAGGPGSPGGTPGSEGAGGGVSEVLSNFLIRNSLLVSNTGIGGNCSGLPGKVDGGGNLVFPEAGSCTGFPVGDPKLDPAGLANNGGPTQTIALQSGSAAFNLVPTASCTDAAGAPLTADQRGEPRPQFGACDAGAFEIAEPKKPPTAATAPKVTFTKKPKKVVKTRKKRAKVKFAFTSDTAGAKFECKLDKEPFKPCKSPKRLRLKPGRHTFLVRGTSAGLTGEAAKAAFKVKRLKARHKRASQ